MPLEFADFELDPAARQLRRAGAPVAVEPKVLDLLLLLARDAGRVISRPALERALWPGVRVSPAALSRLVKEARRVLGDDGRAQSYIETRRARGFRFAAPVRARGVAPADIPYVGRERLLERLDAALEDALAGRGHVLVLAGEPGVGKTRTGEELAARARLRGAQVAKTWGSEAAGAPGFWPWRQLLSELVESAPDPATLRQRLGPSAEPLARLVPALCATAPGAGVPLAGANERFRLFEAVRGFLFRSARTAPVVLVFDDLHWSDAESIELVDFLAHDVARTGLLVLATCREPELDRQARLARVVARLVTRPGVERWPLAGFSKRETAGFIEVATSRPPEPRLVELLFARSDGCPLFLGEILRVAASQGVLESGLEEWEALAPSGLERLIEARVRGLGERTRRTLSEASALGCEFEHALLQRASTVGADALRAALAEGESARVVVPAAGRPGWYRFTHAVVRDALYAELDPGERIEVHARIASALERAPLAEEPDPDCLAHHCFEALELCGVEQVVRALTRAGERALCNQAFDVAARHLGRALALLDGSVDAHSPRRCALLLQLGEALRLLGDVPAAREAFGAAAELAALRGDAVEHAHAALGFAGLYGYGPPDPGVVESLERVLGVLGPEHQALSARVLGRLASELMLDPSPRRRAELRRRAWRAASNGGDMAAIVEIAAHPDHGIWDTMVPPRRRLVLAERYARRCAERGLPLYELAARVMVQDELLRLGRIQDYDARVDEVDRLGAHVAEPQLLWVRRLQGFSRELVRGDLDAAAECAEGARDFGQRHLHPLPVLALWGRQLAVLRAEQGRLAELREPWERAGAGAATPSNRAIHAWICAADGDLDRAAELAAPLLAEGAAAIAHEPMASANAAVLAEVCVRLDDPRPASSLLGLLEPYAGMNAIRTYAACHGPVDRFRGLLEALRGREDAARRHHGAALALAERMGSPTFAARSRGELAALGAPSRARAGAAGAP